MKRSISTNTDKLKLITQGNSFFPPRQIAKYEPSKEELDRAHENLKLKDQFYTTMEYTLFSGNLQRGLPISADELKQLNKDQRNYLKIFTTRLHKKFPAELNLTEKQFKAKSRQLKRKAQVVLSGKPRKKFNLTKDKHKQDKEAQKSAQGDDDKYNKIDIGNSEPQPVDSGLDDISDMPNESDGDMEDDGGYGDDM